MDNNITVSIFMMTYNHEKYIAEALNSVIMQKVDFQYEIVLGDDCSTDNTREIVVKYAQRYPGKFKLLLHKTNIGAVNNQVEVLKNCTGKYIAMLEGDDYWTDPLKLQKQVDFLEANPEYIICGHDRSIIDKNYNLFIETGRKDLNTQGLLTLTVVFRNHFFTEQFFKSFAKVSNGDSILFLYLEQFGKSILLDFNGANYRIHDGGVWSSISKEERYKNAVNSYLQIINYFELTKNKFFIRKSYFHLANIEIDYGYLLINKSLYKKAIKQFFKFNKIFIFNNLSTSYFLLIKINVAYLTTLIKSRISKF